MELRLGIAVPATGARADVLVRARDGACLGEVSADLLARVLPAGRTGRLTVDGREVDAQTLLGAPPLVQGALLELDVPAAPPFSSPWQLRQVSGSGAGNVHPLPYGEVLVGRGAALDVDDPQASRRHCLLHVDPDGVRLRDLGSANGTTLDGAPVGNAEVVLAAGAVLRVGGARLVLAAAPEPPPPLRPTGDGRLAIDRPPRLRPAQPVVQVVVPTPPTAPERGALPVLSVLAPLVLGVVMWRVTGSTTFLLLTLLSPVLVVGACVTERRTGRRRSRRDRALWAAQRAVAEQVLADAVRADERARREQWPDLAEVLTTATGPGPRLWERRRGELDVRLGTGDLPARVEADGDLDGLRTTARDVPVAVALADVGVLGLAGDRGLARAVVVQLCTLTSPRDLQVVVLTETGAGPAWEWARELPHLAPDGGQDCTALLGLGPAQAQARVAELCALLDRRAAEPRVQVRPVVVVVDGARALRAVPGLARLLAEGPALGVLAVCVDQDARLLPPECRASAVPTGGGLVVRVDGGDGTTCSADLLAPSLAERAARAMAPLRDDRRDADGAQDLPTTVRWTEQVGLQLDGGDGAAQVLQRWTGGSTTALLGRTARGPLLVDLVRDGPHALVAGTTGSGKSELLQTLIASLALANRPDQLVMVLVDYKGGAAFGPCEHLPHVVGMVTDLDAGLVERALASLAAELSRREGVLRAAGVKDLEDHRRLADPAEPLPRLVIVVDEFASLAEELPELLSGLVAIAMRGRSLGVHLVLATQRPEGVVSADVRANTNLRLCLAVTRDGESRDVLDSPVAATISRSTPGRAWVRTGHADLTAFQAARVGGRRPAAVTAAGPTVQLLPTAELGEPVRGQVPDDAASTTDLELLVEACRGASAALGLPPARSPWLPPLPDTVVRTDLPPHPVPAGHLAALTYALVDLPGEQRRAALALDLDAGSHLLVVGAARSGRTTVLRSLAGALATTASPDDVHLYAVDGGSGLAPLSRLPHTGAVVGLDQVERVGRLLRWLVEETVRRQALLAAQGHGSICEQRASGSDPSLPHLLLLVDRWEAFVAAFQDVDAGRLVDAVHRLLREGPAAGLHVVLTTDRSGLLGRTASLVDDRLLLRLGDPTDYAVAGLPLRSVPADLPAGRGWTLRGAPHAVQVALLDPDPSGPAQAAALLRLAGQCPPAVRPPRRVEQLPTAVRRADLPQVPGASVVGVGGDELGPVALTRADLENGFLVGGPARSGRSSALLLLAAAVPDLPVVAVAPRPSPLRALPGCLTDPDDVEALHARLRAGPVTLLLDDLELLVDGPLGLLLEQAVRSARDTGTVVVAAGSTDQLLLGYRGAAVELRRARTGLVLSPQTTGDGALLDLRRTVPGELLPGRGLLVRGADVLPVQLARS